MKRPSLLLSVLLIELVCFCSCTTVTPPSSVDYTDGRSVIREIETVRDLIEEKPLEALLRAKRLTLYSESMDDINVLYQETELAVEKLFFDAVDNGTWAEALKIFRSLAALGNAPTQWSEQKLMSAQRDKWKEKKIRCINSRYRPIIRRSA